MGAVQLRLQRPALLMIDLQNDLVHPQGLLSQGYAQGYELFLPQLQGLQQFCRDHQIPVIYTRVAFRPGYLDASMHSPSRLLGSLLDGSWGAAIADHLAPLPEEPVVIKRRTSAFYNTELEVLLRSYGAQSLILSGVATNLAVESTARDAYCRDYEVVVASDCCCAQDDEFHRASLRCINQFFGHTVLASTIISRLTDREEK